MSTTEDVAGGELREGYAEVGDQRLHYVEAGAVSVVGKVLPLGRRS